MRGLISRYHSRPKDGVASLAYAFFVAKVGRCTTCMRQSLTAALIMWAVLGLGMMAWPGMPVQYVTGAIAFALTALWLLHIAVYATRNVAEARAGKRTFNASIRGDGGFDHVGRRQALRTVLRAAGVGVIASVPVLLLPSAALAFCGQCSKNADCGVGWVCRNTAPVNSGRVCNECVKA